LTVTPTNVYFRPLLKWRRLFDRTASLPREQRSAKSRTIPQPDAALTHRCRIHTYDMPDEDGLKFCNLLGLVWGCSVAICQEMNFRVACHGYSAVIPNASYEA